MNAPSQLLLAIVLALAAGGCGGGDDAEPDPATAARIPFDRAFIDAMVPHHEDAIEMAQAAKEAGLSAPELVQVADDVVATQQAEIDRMLEWREEWYGSRDVDPPAGALKRLGLTADEAGMAHAPDEVAAAEDVNQAFAEMMISHHEGAIAMAELATDRAEHSEIRELSVKIIEAQTREIAVLEPHAGGAHH